ncbi:MAG: toxic anion resistance protein [Halanaerobiales bacterium]|nr:toxic anion resistance protein [Halanaerobiales bacterium]
MAQENSTKTLKLSLPNTSKLKEELALVKPEEIVPTEQDKNELEEFSDAFVKEILSFEENDFDAMEKSKASIELLGDKVQKEATRRSRMLQEPIGKLSQRGEDGGEVAKALIDLKMKVEDLDPNKIDFSKPGWFSRSVGTLPFVGTPLKKYFSKYEQAQVTIDAIVNSLKNGKEMLKRDNITLQEDQKVMREATLKLEKIIKIGQMIDNNLNYKIEREYPEDHPKYKFISEELIFPLRQRLMDLQQQLAVNQQGVLAIEIIIRNNKELMRGVDRAINVTVNALQVAVIVALALANQKIVLDKINALNKTTSQLIQSTAEKLKTQGIEIHKQASSSMMDMDALKGAFKDINEAMDDIATFRKEALPKMAQTILEFDDLTRKGEERILQMEQGNRVAPAISFDL